MNPTESLRERIARAIAPHLAGMISHNPDSETVVRNRDYALKVADAILALLPTHQPAEAGELEQRLIEAFNAQDDYTQNATKIEDRAGLAVEIFFSTLTRAKPPPPRLET